jgi:hypothetical protein
MNEGKKRIVMDEFSKGTLKSGSGQAVTDPKQAYAIAMSEARKASDVNVKKNIKDASGDLDTFVQSDVLQRLIKDMGELSFGKRLRPKVVTIEMESGSAEDLADAEPAEESPAGPLEEDQTMDDDEDGLDPRLAALIAKAKGGGKA